MSSTSSTSHCGRVYQFSTCNPATRENSRTFAVTKMAPKLKGLTGEKKIVRPNRLGVGLEVFELRADETGVKGGVFAEVGR